MRRDSFTAFLGGSQLPLYFTFITFALTLSTICHIRRLLCG